MDAFEKHLRIIRKATPDDIALFVGPQAAEVVTFIRRSNDETILDSAWAEGLVNYADMVIEQRRQKAMAKKATKYSRKGANRSEYLPTPRFRAIAPNGYVQWRFDKDIQAMGLVPRMVDYLYGMPERPVAMQLFNDLPTNPETKRPYPVPSEEFDYWSKEGYEVSDGRVAWDRRSPAWEWLRRAFPTAIDFRAYNHSLRAPLIPEGFLAEVPVLVKTVTSYGEDGVEMPAGVDGSGAYNPSCPHMQGFISQHGAVAFQFRGMLPIDGTFRFAKGILVPREDALDAEGRPCIQIDPLQIKSSGKSWAKELVWDGGDFYEETVEGCFIGAMAARNRKSIMYGGFEMLENIQTNQDTLKVVCDLTDRAMDKLAAGGIDGLLVKAARRDQNLATLVKLLARGRELGINVDPMSIKMAREQIHEQLERALWPIAQGAGIYGTQAYIVLDEGVPLGCCVTGDYPVGQELATWRFPMVVEQGLMLVENVAPLRHHMVDGEVPPHLIFLNPKDTVDRQQSDDDGDIVAISASPKVRWLFKQTIGNDKIYLIEPDGNKFSTPTSDLHEEYYCETRQEWVRV